MRRELAPALIITGVMVVAGAVLTLAGGRILWWANAPVWLLAVPGALTGNAIGQLALTAYYLDTFLGRLHGEKEWVLLAPPMASGLLFLAGVIMFDASSRAAGGPGGWPVEGVLASVVVVTAVVRYWLPDRCAEPDRDAREHVVASP